MTRSTLGAGALALCILVFASLAQAQDKTPAQKTGQKSGGYALSVGIGNLTWGSELSKVKGFLKLKSADGIEYYVNLRSTAQFAGYKNPTLFYATVDGKLYAVHIRLENAAYDKLRSDLTRAYGPGKMIREPEGEVMSWKVGHVRLKLKSPAGPEIKLSAYYRPLAARLAVGKAYGDPGSSEELARLLPQGDNVQKEVGVQPSGAKEPAAGIDVGRFLGVITKKQR
ncbi:hypothetical protein JCM15519_18220 [Fundidesulfovibrio butyratiphilus]